ncbi:MAG: pentapeptide repeat-containing protein, partial [Gammaproteobacteria bacterium]|nr:pentapeptide repeat-containing protein [Gammaproteobacteria bacterium]
MKELLKKWGQLPWQPWLAGILVFLCLLFLILLLYAALSLPHVKCEGANLPLLCYWLGVGTKEAVINKLSIALAGLLSAWAIWSAYRRAEAMQKQVLATENRLVQERFRDAVQHLGDESESVRLGGAYALFRLALEEEGFRKQIAEMICAHICAITSAKKYRGDFAKKPSMEIQSLMRLLFSVGQDAQTENSRKAFWKGLRADLSGGYFHGLELRDARFQKASLTGAEFQGASLSGAQFHGASLVGTKFHVASLENSQFHDAYLLGAEFHDARLYRAEFHGASLVGAEFHGVSLENAQFQGANLENAEFQGAALENAGFQGARLYRVGFQGATLVFAGFQGARLYRVGFQGALLVGAKFQGARLYRVGFQGALLVGAKFQG